MLRGNTSFDQPLVRSTSRSKRRSRSAAREQRHSRLLREGIWEEFQTRPGRLAQLNALLELVELTGIEPVTS
jgi:hypothetical protein